MNRSSGPSPRASSASSPTRRARSTPAGIRAPISSTMRRSAAKHLGTHGRVVEVVRVHRGQVEMLEQQAMDLPTEFDIAVALGVAHRARLARLDRGRRRRGGWHGRRRGHRKRRRRGHRERRRRGHWRRGERRPGRRRHGLRYGRTRGQWWRHRRRRQRDARRRRLARHRHRGTSRLDVKREVADHHRRAERHVDGVLAQQVPAGERAVGRPIFDAHRVPVDHDDRVMS